MKRFIILLVVMVLMAVPLMAEERSATVTNVITIDTDVSGVTQNYVTGVRVYLNSPLEDENGSTLVADIEAMLMATETNWNFPNWVSGNNPEVLIDTFQRASSNSFYILFDQAYWDSDTGVTTTAQYDPDETDPPNYIYTENGTLLSFSIDASDNVNPKPLIANVSSSNDSDHYLKVGDTITFDLTFTELLLATPIITVRSGGVQLTNNVSISHPSGFVYVATVVLHQNDIEDRERIEFLIRFRDANYNFGDDYTDVTLYDEGNGNWFIFDKSVPAINDVAIEELSAGDNPTNGEAVSYLITWEEDFVYNFDAADISCVATDINGDPVVVDGTFVIDPVRYNEDVVNTIQFTMDNADFNGTISFVIQDEVDGIEDAAGNNTTEAIVVADGIDYDYVIDNTNPPECAAPTFSAVTNESVIVNVAAVTEAWYPDAGFYYNFREPVPFRIGDYQESGYLDLNDTDHEFTGYGVNTEHTFVVDVMDYAGNETVGANEASFYTLANPPINLVIDNPGTTTIDISWDLNGSPEATEYAVMNGADYVQGPGMGIDTEATWITATEWNGIVRGDVNITVTGLTPGTEYEFEVIARNGDNVETSSITGSLYTLPVVPTLSSVQHPDDTEYYSSADLTVDAAQDAGAVAYYKYIFNQTEVPEISAVEAGTVDEGAIEETIGADGTWYMHVLAYNGNDVRSDGYATFTVNYDGTEPTGLDVTIDDVQVDQVTISGAANFDLAGAHDTAAYNYFDGTLESGFVAADHTFTGLDENTQYTFQMKGRDNAIVPNVNAEWGGDESAYTLLQDLLIDDITVVPTADGYEVDITPIANPEAGISGYKWLLDGSVYYDWDEEDHEIVISGQQYNELHEISLLARNGDGTETNTLSFSFYTLAEVPGAPVLDNAAATTFAISFDKGANASDPEAVIRVEDLTNSVVSYVYENAGAYYLTAGETWLDLGANPEITLEDLTSNTNYQVDIKFRNGDDIETAWSSPANTWTTIYDPVISLPGIDNAEWFKYDTPSVEIDQSEGEPSSSYTLLITQEEPAVDIVTVSDVIDHASSVDVETVYGWDGAGAQNFDLLGTEIGADGVWYLYAVGYNGDGIPTANFASTNFNYDFSGPEFGDPAFSLTADWNDVDGHSIEIADPNADFSFAGANAAPWEYNMYIGFAWVSLLDWVDLNSVTVPGLDENTYYEFSLGARDAALPDFNESDSEIDGIFTLAEPPLAEEITFTGITTSSFTANVAAFTNDFMVTNGGYNFQLWIDGEVEPAEESGWQTGTSYLFDGLTEYENYTVKVAYRNAAEVATNYAENTVWTLPETPGTLTLSNPQMISIDRLQPEIYTMDLFCDIQGSRGRAQEDALFALKAVYNDGVEDIVKWVDSATFALETIAEGNDPDFLTHAGWFGDPAAAITVTDLEEFELYTFTVYALDSETGALIEGGSDSRYSLPALPTGFVLDSHDAYSLTVTVNEYIDGGAGLEYWYYLDEGAAVVETDTPTEHVYDNLVPFTEYDLKVRYATPDPYNDLTEAVTITEPTEMTTPGTPGDFVAGWDVTDGFTIQFAFDAVAEGESLGNQEAGQFAVKVTYGDPLETKYVNLFSMELSDYAPAQCIGVYNVWNNNDTVKGLDPNVEYTFMIEADDYNYLQTIAGGAAAYYSLPEDVDTITSTSHGFTDPLTWYNNDQLDAALAMSVGHPAPASYNYLVTQTETVEIADLTSNTLDGTVTAAGLGDGVWYLHAVAVNGSDNTSIGIATFTFQIDTTDPTYTGFAATDITTSSIELTVTGAEDPGDEGAKAGLNTEGAYWFELDWQVENSYTHTDLDENTLYEYQATIRDNAVEPNTTVTDPTVSVYTLCEDPTGLAIDSQTSSTITASVDGFPNDSAGLSGYHWVIIDTENENNEVTNITTNSNTNMFEGLSPNVHYYVEVSYMNGDGEETAVIGIDAWTDMVAAGAPTLSNPTINSLDVTFAAQSRAQEGGSFAIVVTAGGPEMYVQANGSLGGEFYQDYASWNSPVTITPLVYYTEYTVLVRTKDADGDTHDTATDVMWTLPQDVDNIESSHAEVDVYYNDDTADFIFNMPDGDPAPHGYYYAVNRSETAVMEDLTEEVIGSNEVTDYALGVNPDGDWYVHVVAINPDLNSSTGITSRIFKVDMTDPTYDSFSVTDAETTENSITVEVTDAADALSGLNAEGAYWFELDWQEENSYTYMGLDENTWYEYQAVIRDNAVAPNETTTTTAGTYTHCAPPTGLVVNGTVTDTSIPVTIDTFTNDGVGLSGYRFVIFQGALEIENSGRLTVNEYEFTGLDPNVEYTVYGSYFNADEMETDPINISLYTNMGIAGTPVLSNPTTTTMDVDFTALAAVRGQEAGNFGIVVTYDDPDDDPDAGVITAYVQSADGSLGDFIDYQNFAAWNNGAVTMTGLIRYTEYTVLIRTQDYEEPLRGTHNSETASLWTLPSDVDAVTSDTHESDTVWYNATAMDVDAAMAAGHPAVDGFRFYASQNAIETADTVHEYGTADADGLDYIHTFGDDDDGVWYLHAIAYNSDGNYSEGATSMMVQFDNDAPTYDTIVITDTTSTSVTIQVTGATDNGLAGLNEFAYIYYDGMPTRIEDWTGDTSWTFTNLEPNTEHNLYVGLRDAATNPNETLEGPYTVRTMAVTPAAPQLVNYEAAWIDLEWNLEGANFGVDGLANESDTEYALYEVNTGMYLDNSDELGSAVPVWFAVPDTFEVGVLGLTPETNYEFKLMARNDDDIETDMSDPLYVTTDSPDPTNALIHLEQDGEELTPGSEELTVGELFNIIVGIYEIDKYGQEVVCYNYDMWTFFQTNYPNNLVTNSMILLFVDGIAEINNAYVNAELDDLYIYMYLMGYRDDDEDFFQYGPIAIGPAEIDEPGYAMVTDNPDDQGGWINLSYELSENDPFYAPTAVAPYVDYYVLERQIGTAPVREEIPGIYEVVAFIMPYNPTSGNIANVLIEVPASDSVFNYRIAAVFNAEPYGRLAGDEPVVIYADEMEMTRDAYTSGYAECGSTNAADNIGGYADFTVYLEGAYSGGVMSSNLELPLVSPYDGEAIEALPVVDSHSLIDWVQVELRTSATGSTVKSCNAFLLEDGSLVDVNGETDLPFYYTTGHDYYIVINHRNHIAVMTAESYELADFAAEATDIDLASSSSAVYGNGIKNLGTDYAMYAADVTADGFIGNDDMNTWAVNWGSSGYLNSDVDLDGQVAQTDMLIWAVNWAKSGTVPNNMRLADNTFSSELEANKKKFNIHYGINNAELVEYENGDVYYEFDVIATADKASHFYSGQVFLGYNTEIFGTVAHENNNVFVSGSELVEREIEVPGPAPAINAYSVMAADFDKGILAAGSVWNPQAVNQVNFENANMIHQETQSYLHVAMKCNAIPEEDINLVWFVENDLLTNQQTYLDHESNWQSFSGIVYDALELGVTPQEPQTVPVTHITGVYPNPFNPTTTLYFELGEASPVSLEIYNIRGQKVRSMNMGELSEGNHNISWNGTNNQGADCGTGVYFFKLNTGFSSEMTRVLMLK